MRTGPKLEYLLISLVGSAAMLAMGLTGNMEVTFVTSAVMGLSRAALYTVPFVLANQLFQSRVSLVITRIMMIIAISLMI